MPKKRSSHLHKHKQENLRRQLLFLNNYFEDQEYLKSNYAEEQEFIQMMVDLYDEGSNSDLITDINTGIGSSLLNTLKTGHEKMINLVTEIDSIRESRSFRNLPFQVAEVVTKFIELLDLTKLPSLASVHNVSMLLSELHIKIDAIEKLELPEITQGIDRWMKKINSISLLEKIMGRSKKGLSGEQCLKLEEDVSKWLELFKIKLSKL
jgi:hypothetical protein